MKESSHKEAENEEQVPQESPEENIQYEVDEPIILLDPRGNINLLLLTLMLYKYKLYYNKVKNK